MDKSRLQLTQRKPNDHFRWGGLLGGVKLAGISAYNEENEMREMRSFHPQTYMYSWSRPTLSEKGS